PGSNPGGDQFAAGDQRESAYRPVSVPSNSGLLADRRQTPDSPDPPQRRHYGLPPGERPRLTNSRRFGLEYDVDAVGPQGVASVELWTTTDGGQTWSLWGQDADRVSPFDVEVDAEGIYGFRVVIVGNSGLAGRAPRSGDLADIWVAVDATAPQGRLTSASYGQGAEAGHLLIQWEADDDWLAPRPITLLFSDQLDGPWTTLASGLPNDGRYAWKADPRVPRKIYLRMEVRDEAGNVGTYQLSDPISADGLTPRGRIRGIRPLDSGSP
ncbi:MAG: hypothetical protein J5I93_18710, partial [Pirellulaceae bacterium]|nr:hypothetical protein [Pirellulaceae bacterium]